ncbi:MAG: hypothetical protein ACM30E_11690, partial [Nitrososphaerales archaeon]
TLLPVGSQARTVKTSPLQDVYRLSLPEASVVTLRRFYYPGWQAWIDGQPVPIWPSSPYGLIELTAPAGESELKVSWGTTPPRTAGWLLFGAGLLLTTALLLRGDRPTASPQATAGVRAGWLPFVSLILVLAGLKVWWIEPHTQWFRLQSPVDAPAGMTHALQARYVNGVELLGYDLPYGEVKQGGELRVRLYWRTHQRLDQNLKSYLHLDAPATQETWANFTKEHAGDTPSKGWPVGFYVVDDFRLKVPGDAPPVRANLTVGLLDEAGARVPVSDGGDSVTVSPIVVQGAGRPYTMRSATDAGYRLGDGVTLEAYQAVLTEADPGSGRMNPEVQLTLYWRTATALATDYTVFAHLLNANGERLAQGDGPACGGACPTSDWTPAGIIEDTRMIALPPDVPRDGLAVLVGLYDPQSGQRLPATDRQGTRLPDDAIPLPVGAAPTP